MLLPHDPSRAILEQIAAGGHVSQRTLARDARVALGLAHGLIHRMADQGWVRIVRDGATRIRYEITPAGLAEASRRARAHLAGGVHAYAEARERIAARFARLSAEWPDPRAREKRVAFFGAGDVAEIGYVCLQRTDMRLVAVVDHRSDRSFFGIPVSPLAALSPDRVGEVPYGSLVIMSMDTERDIRRTLAALGCRPSSAAWL